MLFGIDFCRGCNAKRRQRDCGVPIKVCLAVLAALVCIGILFLAPSWLLVLIILMLAAGIAVLACRCRR